MSTRESYICGEDGEIFLTGAMGFGYWRGVREILEKSMVFLDCAGDMVCSLGYRDLPFVYSL